MTITVFYDGNCPLCVAEMDLLRRADYGGKLQLENLHSDGFQDRYPDIDLEAADKILHGLDEAGELIYGLDVTVKAWRAVNQKPWIVCLRWPGIRWFADLVYRFFAKHRSQISTLFMGSASCTPKRCELSSEEGSALIRNTKKKHTSPNCARSINEDAEF